MGIKDYDKPVTVDNKQPKMSFKEQLGHLVKNKPMMILLVSFCISIFSISISISNAANIYYFKYVLDRVDLVPTISAVQLGITILSVFTLSAMVKKFGKKPLFLVSILATIVPYAIMYLFPAMPIPFLFVLIGIIGFFGQISGNLGWSMSMDCIDYGEVEFGVRSNAILTSSITFVNKLVEH